MSERDDKRGGSGVAIGCMLVLFFLPVVYVLSIGPVALLVEHNASLEWIGYLYLPLGLLAEACPPIDDALEWYMDLWRG